MNASTKRNALCTSSLIFGMVAVLQLAPAYAQGEHDAHPDKAPAAQDGKAQQSIPVYSGMMNHQGMDHHEMEQMHEQHMGSGQLDHDMGHGRGEAPKGAEKGQNHDN